jgi:HD-like signal output (HDOD) protein
MYRTQTSAASGPITEATSSPGFTQREEAFAFVQSLAKELSAGKVELPSFPDVALKVRKALDDESVTVGRIARIAGSEAGLAARILVMANSPAMGYGGKPVTDLQNAVTRVGLSNVRSAALAFALAQLRRATQYKHIMRELEQLWRQSTQVAALCRVMGLKIRGINADLAMLAGLLHNIGSVYILARAAAGSGIIRDAEMRESLLRDWSPSIGRSIAENWGLPDEVVEAIGQQSDTDRTRRGSADLNDVLFVAVSVAEQLAAKSENGAGLHGPGELTRLGLDDASWAAILTESETDIMELQAALSG